MADLPVYFIEEVRSEILDETAYTDNEIKTFARISLNRYAPLLQSDHTTIDGATLYDFTVNGDPTKEYWEVIKWATIVGLLDHYRRKSLAEGIGVSLGIGAERIDTKTVLMTLNAVLKDAKKTLNQKLLAYNMLNKAGVIVDLYSDWTNYG